MIKPKFPGMECIKIDEGLLFIKMLKKEGYNAVQISDLLTTVDECLTIQKSAAIIDAFSGKRKYNKRRSKDIIYERAAQLEL